MFSAASKKKKKCKDWISGNQKEMENGQIKNLLNYSVDPDTDRA